MALRELAGVFLLLGSVGSVGVADPTRPLSAVDWLSNSIDLPPEDAAPTETPVAETAGTPAITVTALDAPSPDQIGILTQNVTDLPPSLWSGSSVADINAAILALPAFDIPVVQDFVTTLMLAEAAAPIGSTPQGAFLLARVDQLLNMGRLEEAAALLEAAKPDTPALFQRYFDVALLLGQESRGCDLLSARPALTPTTQVRIFCLARNGDWPAAALLLNTNRVLGDLDAEEVELLTLFLDPEIAEASDRVPTPDRITPLVFRIKEAVGERRTTGNLPLAFAHADLTSTTGWKAQLDAAERLARAGSLSPGQLQQLYGTRTPSASGGVWDRIDASQTLQDALLEQDRAAISSALPDAWDAMTVIRSEALLSALFAPDLRQIALEGDAEDFAAKIELLGPDYRSVQGFRRVDPFLGALANGTPQDVRATKPQALAVQAAFNGADPDPALLRLYQDGQLGLSTLKALVLFHQGVNGDYQALTRSLATLRAFGFEDLARRASLQFLILDRAR